MLLTLNRVFNTVYFGAVARAVFSKKLGTFAGHPICMSLAWFFLTEGIFAFRKRKAPVADESKPNLTWNKLIDNHMTYMFMAFVLATVGASFVYVSKEEGGREHFLTIHGFAGGLVTTFLVMDGISASISRNFKLGNRMTWTAHKLFGYALVASCWAVSYLHIGNEDGYLFKAFAKIEGDFTATIGQASFIMSALTLVAFLINRKI